MSPTEALRKARYINLETFKKDGSGVKTPVWFANVGDRLGVFTNGNSYKVKRLRRDPRVQVAICDVRGKVPAGAQWYAGTGQIVTDAVESDAVYAALKAKYGWQMAISHIGGTLSGRKKDWMILMLDLDEGT